MKPWQRVVLLCALIAGVLAEKCERHEAKQGCTVEDGHAQCEAWNMTASTAELPSCTTKITFSLLAEPGNTHPRPICLQRDTNVIRLPNLQELTIRTNHQNFVQRHCLCDFTPCYQTLLTLHLRVLRIQMLCSKVHINERDKGIFSRLKSLDTLDLTRGQQIGLNAIKHELGSQPTMRVLTLKNIQLFRAEGYTYSLDLVYFACGGNVQQLDLSYNDIVALNLSADCRNSKLQYLNLDHNLLAQMIPVKTAFINVLPMLADLQVFRASTSLSGYHGGLWDEPEEINLADVSDNTETDSSRLSALLFPQQAPFGFLATRYGDWLRDALKICDHKTYLDIMTCVVNYNDSDSFILCLEQGSNGSCSQTAGLFTKVNCVMKHRCNYSCENLPTIPLPASLTSITMHNPYHLKRELPQPYDYTCKSYNLSFHPNNKLQVLDFPSLASDPTFRPFNLDVVFTLSGLHSMKYVNIQNHPVSFLLSRIKSTDMRDLEVLHIGGRRVSENDILPRHSLETFTKLSVLNLSYSNLRGFETDVFLKHTRLAVLDLSHNQLTAPFLSSLDLSHTGLVSLNLSHNQLTSIPSSLRHQLENMEGLELYLSGNRFICNCDNLAFLEWIQSGLPITLHYVGDHVCEDAPDNTIHNIEVDSLHCDWYWKQPLILVCSPLAAILLVTALVMMYKKRFHISNLVFRLQERFCLGSGDSSGTVNYTFDAFVIYSSTDDDRMWVHYVLRKVLEEDFGFRLCIHHRNFPGGVPIVDNIEKAIRTSRKVLLVMSENFLKSDWCLKEVQMTSSVDRRKFVIVMYKDVLLSGVHIPTEVRHLLETITYIEWHDQPTGARDLPIEPNEHPEVAEKLFWKRLRKALYNKRQMSQGEAGPQDQIVLLNQI